MIYKNDKLHNVKSTSVEIEGVKVDAIRKTTNSETDSLHIFSRTPDKMPKYSFDGEGNRRIVQGGRSYQMRPYFNMVEKDDNGVLQSSTYRYCDKPPAKDKNGVLVYSPSSIEIPESGMLTVDASRNPSLFWFITHCDGLSDGVNYKKGDPAVLVYENPNIREAQRQAEATVKMDFYRLISTISDEGAQAALSLINGVEPKTSVSMAKQFVDSSWSAATTLEQRQKIVEAMEASISKLEPNPAPPASSPSSERTHEEPLSNTRSATSFPASSPSLALDQIEQMTEVIQKALEYGVVQKVGNRFEFKPDPTSAPLDLGGLRPGTNLGEQESALAVKLAGDEKGIEIYREIKSIVESQGEE